MRLTGRVAVSGQYKCQRRHEVIRRSGYPFLELGWGRDAMGLVIGDDTDWDEVAELVTESFCVMAPKKLAAQVDRPPPEA